MWICQEKCYLKYTLFVLFIKLFASLMRNDFLNGRRVRCLTLCQTNMMFQLVLYPHPPFEAAYCFICDRQRMAVTRHRMICIVLTFKGGRTGWVWGSLLLSFHSYSCKNACGDRDFNGNARGELDELMVSWLWFNVTFSDIVTGQLSSFQILTCCRAPNVMGS